MDGVALTLADKIAKGEFTDKIDNRIDDEKYDTVENSDLNGVESNVRMNILTWSEARYQEWDTMHDMTIWFDTGACMQGGFIGDVNKVTITPKSAEMFKKWNNTCDADDVAAGYTDCAKYTSMEASTVDAHTAQYP